MEIKIKGQSGKEALKKAAWFKESHAALVYKKREKMTKNSHLSIVYIV